jgi:hypothetical protein
VKPVSFIIPNCESQERRKHTNRNCQVMSARGLNVIRGGSPCAQTTVVILVRRQGRSQSPNSNFATVCGTLALPLCPSHDRTLGVITFFIVSSASDPGCVLPPSCGCLGFC